MRKVVLDTNILLVSISEKSRLYWIFENLINKKFALFVTTEILFEYAEIIEQHMGTEISQRTLNTLLNLKNLKLITAYYKFRLLKDEDDDKFVDCAIAANAEYIVSHDKDFNILKQIEFPKIKVINTEQFKIDLNQN